MSEMTEHIQKEINVNYNNSDTNVQKEQRKQREEPSASWEVYLLSKLTV